MLEKLKLAASRLQSIESLLEDPGIYSKQDEMKRLLAEKKELAPVVEMYHLYLEVLSDIEVAKQLLIESSDDEELHQLATEELEQKELLAASHLETIKGLLLRKDPDDRKSVVMEIRAGTGGEESALFAADLFRMYCMFAEKHHLKIERNNESTTELGGFKEICFSVVGEGAYGLLKYESGVHRVQRVPKTESQGRIQTSAVTVAVLPEAEDVEIDIKPTDIKVESCKSSGAGGQHINKTDSAIRMTHLPTGIVVTCQDERSQLKNREKAMMILKAKLYEYYQGQKDREYAANRKSMVGTGDRSERIRTYNFPQGRISDHRINFTAYNLLDFMNGAIDTLIEELKIADQRSKLENLT